MAGENDDFGSSPVKDVLLVNYRKCVQSYIDSHQYSSAAFWADKVVSLSNGNRRSRTFVALPLISEEMPLVKINEEATLGLRDVNDVYLLAQCFLLTKQYHRAAHCIKSRDLDKSYSAFRYLAAKSHHDSKEYQEALFILDGRGSPEIESSNMDTKPDQNTRFPIKNVESSLKLLRGKIYEAMDNRNLAADCFKDALFLDVHCYEAFEALVQHQMLSSEEEHELLASLPFTQQCSNSADAEVLSFLYENMLKKYSKPSMKPATPSLSSLTNNFDVLISEAERHYYNCDYSDCFKLTTMVLEKDPYHKECLPIHIACLVELKETNNIFHLAHKLVDLYPDSSLSWFAVGCYYLLCGKNDPARRYLSKATTLDRVFGPAWLAYGHSFAVENEHDQAMAAYFKASKLMKGCHLPLLYIGLEYGLTNNPRLAEKFFSQALAIAPQDPFVLHEMGVIAFQNQELEAAERYFRDALDKVQVTDNVVVADKWEPLLNNLGHTCRKLKKYKEALEFHERALVLCPQSASTFAAVGYVHSLTGNSSLAVDYFHKALGLRRDDTFSTAMLGNVVEQLMNDVSPYEGAPDEIPLFEMPKGKFNLTAEDTVGSSVLEDLSTITDVEMDVTE